jgi:hypothetical protein
MANTSRKYGFQPYGEIRHVGEYTASAAIYPGDLVIQESGGRVQACSTGSTLFSSAAIGVAVSYASASAAKVLVADDPQQEFSVQADDSTVDALTDMGLNYNVVGNDPDTTYKLSRMELDASSQATDSNLTCKLVRIDPAQGNALGDKAKVIVKINNHQRGSGTGTTGV